MTYLFPDTSGIPFEPLANRPTLLKQKKELRLKIKSEYWIAAMNKIETDSGLNSAGVNTCTKLYFFLWFLVSNQIKVNREALEEAVRTNSRALSKYISILEEKQMISMRHTTAVIKEKGFVKGKNEYQVFSFDFARAGLKPSKSLSLSFSLSNIIYNFFLSLIPIPSIVAPILISNNCVSESYPKNGTGFWGIDSFFQELMVKLPNGEIRKLCITPKTTGIDGRIYYNEWHGMSKEARERDVIWDGENVSEVWDAPSAFWSLLPVLLVRDERFKEQEEDVLLYDNSLSEIQKLHWCTSFQAYPDFYTFVGRNIGEKDRQNVKKLLQCYTCITPAMLFRNDGEYDQRYAHLIKLDQFYQREFPLIRGYILNFPIRDEDGKKDLQSSVRRNEFDIISNGLCKWLYETKGIKSVTVHDAIYCKISDASPELKADIQKKYEQLIASEIGKFQIAR